MTEAEKTYLAAIKALEAAIEKLDVAAGYDSALYTVRDALVDQLDAMKDAYSNEEAA